MTWATAARVRATCTRAAAASARAAALYGDDPLLGSVPGMGPMTAPTVRAFLSDACRFDTAKAAASYVGMNPSTWSSGTVVQPSRAITKEGSAVLRLAGRPCLSLLPDEAQSTAEVGAVRVIGLPQKLARAKSDSLRTDPEILVDHRSPGHHVARVASKKKGSTLLALPKQSPGWSAGWWFKPDVTASDTAAIARA